MRNKLFGLFVAIMFVSFFLFAQDYDVGIPEEQELEIKQNAQDYDVGSFEFNYSYQQKQSVSLSYENPQIELSYELDDGSKNPDLISYTNTDLYILASETEQYICKNPDAIQKEKTNSPKRCPRDSLRKTLSINYNYIAHSQEKTNSPKRCPRDGLSEN